MGSWSEHNTDKLTSVILTKPDANGTDYVLTVNCGDKGTVFNIAVTPGTANGTIDPALLSGLYYPDPASVTLATLSGFCDSGGHLFWGPPPS